MNNGWKDRIRRARQRGKFLEADIRLAGNFHTCALGEINMGGAERFSVNLIERVSPVLYRAAMNFMYAVRDNEFDKAAEIRREIRKLYRAFPEKLETYGR